MLFHHYSHDLDFSGTCSVVDHCAWIDRHRSPAGGLLLQSGCGVLFLSFLDHDLHFATIPRGWRCVTPGFVVWLCRIAYAFRTNSKTCCVAASPRLIRASASSSPGFKLASNVIIIMYSTFIPRTWILVSTAL